MLKEIIDQYYLDNQKDREQRYFYITDAGKCGRAIFFKFKNVSKEKMEARVLRMFDQGNAIHQLIMKPLFGLREIHVVSSEIKIPPQKLISGRADAVLSDGKALYVLDIKSMNSMLFRVLKEAKEENVYQLQLYLHYFKIPKGILLYVNKDTSELKEFLIQYNPKLAQTLLKGLEALKVKIDNNIIPPRIVDYPKGWQCRYCQFRSVCDMTDDGEVDWENFKEKIGKMC